MAPCSDSGCQSCCMTTVAGQTLARSSGPPFSATFAAEVVAGAAASVLEHPATAATVAASAPIATVRAITRRERKAGCDTVSSWKASGAVWTDGWCVFVVQGGKEEVVQRVATPNSRPTTTRSSAAKIEKTITPNSAVKMIARNSGSMFRRSV